MQYEQLELLPKSQSQNILDHLDSGKSITPLEALERFGCFRLGARIWDLKRKGYNIITILISKNNKQFASYELIK